MEISDGKTYRAIKFAYKNAELQKIGFKTIQMTIAMFLYRNLENSYTADKENFIIEKGKIHQGHS